MRNGATNNRTNFELENKSLTTKETFFSKTSYHHFQWCGREWMFSFSLVFFFLNFFNAKKY